MTTTTHTAVSAARSDRETAIREYDEALARWETAKAHGDKKAGFRECGVLSTRSAWIAKAELQLAEALVDGLPGAESFTPWVKPVSSAKSTRRVELSQEEIEASLAKSAKVLKDPRFSKMETVKTSADQRIAALLKQAKIRGYEVQDPRKAS